MNGLNVQLSPYLTKPVMDAPVGILIVELATVSNAMTISCFSEVAHHPAAIWVSVEKSTYTHDLLGEAKKFSLAILSQNQTAIALKCAHRSRPTTDKCSQL